MTKPNSNQRPYAWAPSLRGASVVLATLLVAAFALLVPAVGSAQDPGYDQYAPTPDTGGNENPQPTDDGGAPVPTSGSDTGGSGDPSGTSAPGTTAPATVPDTTTPDTTGAASGGSDKGRSESRDDRTLDGLAANAADQRDGRRGEGVIRTAQLSSTDGGGSGIGVLLWIVLGAIVLWAVVMGVRNFRGGFDKRSESTT